MDFVFAKDLPSWWLQLPDSTQQAYLAAHPHSELVKKLRADRTNSTTPSKKTLTSKALRSGSPSREKAAQSVYNQTDMVENFYSKLNPITRKRLDALATHIEGKKPIGHKQIQLLKKFFTKYKKWANNLDPQKVGKAALKGIKYGALGTAVIMVAPAVYHTVAIATFLGVLGAGTLAFNKMHHLAPSFSSRDSPSSGLSSGSPSLSKKPTITLHPSQYKHISFVETHDVSTTQIFIKFMHNMIQNYHFTPDEWKQILNSSERGNS